MPKREKTSGKSFSTIEYKYSLILFDLDGTIIKSTFQPREAKAAVIDELRKLGISNNINTDETMMDIIEKASMQIKKKKELPWEKARRRINDILDRFDVEALSRSELIHNSKPTLSLLKDKGLRLGIVTNSGRKGAKLFLENSGLENYFDVIVTRNDMQKMKPSGEGIVKAIDTLGCKRNQVMYVEDSWVDVRSAKNAGVVAVAITGGLSPSERLRQESPDIIINSLGELLDMT